MDKIHPFDIFSGRIVQSGTNVRLELNSPLRNALAEKGADLECRDVRIIIQSEEENGCVVANLYFAKK